jgi:uncharacterized coiled-coil DUF342 family protein
LKKNANESNDIYDACKENVERYFSEVRKITSGYLQSVTDLQQEIIRSWKNTIDSAITLQEKFTEKSGSNPNLSEATVKMVADLYKEVNRAQQLQNEMMLASLDAMRNYIKTFNENVNTFPELRGKVMESFIPFIPQVDQKTVKKAISEFKKTPDRIELAETKS